MKGKKEYCAGCRDDFYNHRENMNGKRGCWSFETAESVTRYKLHWWTAPTVPGAFREVTTNSCHHEPGQYAFYKELPDCAVEAMRPKVNA